MSVPRPAPEGLRGRVPLLAASYAVMTREGVDGREVLLQLRQGTGFMDGWWACGAAGHVEDAGSPTEALHREVEEELGVRVEVCAPLTTVQRSTLAGPREQRADFFFHVTQWSGEPTLLEPDKAAELRWWPLAELPERVVPHERLVLEGLHSGDLPPFVEMGHDQRLVLVAALGANRAIGVDGGMPWHLPEDLKHFKALTMGGVMIMGRRTWDSIGRALPGRTTVVITSDHDWSAPGAIAVHSLAEALVVGGPGEVFIVGGGEIYRQTIELASRLELTEIDASPEAEVFFPEVDAQHWHETRRDPREGFDFVTYERNLTG
ncbi:dihydrofolate reductase [Janibacter limosus]|jgi:dihydrofolate reductase/8-oxo-dGTP pyrophosphatase MutT (NUDIX family)|uniref:dihydrofolate reductase n=1 Tax=Janibacter limosus TaxID=53458 RepID=UPI000A0138CF|nr:dihydrofolate reductase [Janibacter limosus]